MDPGRLWDASERPLDGRSCPGSVRPLAGLEALGPRQLLAQTKPAPFLIPPARLSSSNVGCRKHLVAAASLARVPERKEIPLCMIKGKGNNSKQKQTKTSTKKQRKEYMKYPLILF